MLLLNYKDNTAEEEEEHTKLLEEITGIEKQAVLVEIKRVLENYTTDTYITQSTVGNAWHDLEVQANIIKLYDMLENKMLAVPALQPNIVREEIFKVLDAYSEEVFYSMALSYISSLHKQGMANSKLQDPAVIKKIVKCNLDY